jgi:hypothetical protein
MFGMFGRKARVEGFWGWLAANTSRIQAARDQDIPRVTEEIREEFAKSFPGLVWEITRASSATWLFCVSADGDPKLFPRVEEAVRAAPAIPGWEIQAFRPRGSLNVTLDKGGRTLGYDDIWCSVVPRDGGVHVTLWIRGLSQQTDKALSGGALILLDNAVGEYDAVTRIKQLDRAPLPANPQRSADFFPLAELPGFLDEAGKL